MTAKASFPSRFREFRRIYIWSIRKNRGLAALLTVLLFLVLPLPLLFALPSWRENTQRAAESALKAHTTFYSQQFISGEYSSFLKTLVPMAAVPILLVFCVILTVMLFRYMHTKRSVDLFHALPVGRVPLLLGRWAAGVTALFAPVLLITAVVQVIASANGLVSGVSNGNGTEMINGKLVSSSPPTLGAMLGWLLLMTAAVFTFSMLIAVCSGSIFDTAVSVLGICAGYPLLIWSAGSLASMILPGLEWDFGRKELGVGTAFSPYAAAFVPFVQKAGAGFLLWWLFLTVLMLIGACWLYYRRKSEAAEDNFAFPALKVVIRFLVTAMTAVLAGLLFGNSGVGGFIAGVIFGSLAAHVIVEAVYSRGFQNLKRSMVGYGCFALCFLAFYGILATGCFGYDMRVPDAAQVESVTFPSSSGREGTNVVYSDNGGLLKTIDSPELTNRQSISTALDENRKIETLFRQSSFPYSIKNMGGRKIAFEYRLKNGRIFRRSYQYYDKSLDQAAFQKCRRSVLTIPEYVKKSDLLFYLDPDVIRAVHISTADHNANKTIYPTAEQKQKLMEALRADLLAGKVNQDQDYDISISNPISVEIRFQDDIPVEDGRLKELLGNYQGTVQLGGSDYSLSEKSTRTGQLIHSFGWDK